MNENIQKEDGRGYIPKYVKLTKFAKLGKLIKLVKLSHEVGQYTSKYAPTKAPKIMLG